MRKSVQLSKNTDECIWPRYNAPPIERRCVQKWSGVNGPLRAFEGVLYLRTVRKLWRHDRQQLRW